MQRGSPFSNSVLNKNMPDNPISALFKKTSRFTMGLALFASFSLGGGSVTGQLPERLAAEFDTKRGQSSEHIFIAQRIPIAPIQPQDVYDKVYAIIEEEYYDQTFNNQDWEKHWKNRYRGQLKTLEDAHKAVETMLVSLGDRYTRFLDRDAFADEKAQIDAHLFGIGVQIGMDKSQRVVVIAPIDDAPAAKAGVLPGDEIEEIDTKLTKGMSVEEAAKLIKGPKGTKVQLTLVTKGQRRKVAIVRDEIHISSIQSSKMLDDGIGYIRLTSFISHDANKEMRKALSDLSSAQGLILDLRDNPGGLLSNAIEISNMFLEPDSRIVKTVDKDGYVTPSKSTDKPIWKGPLAILINRGSASASEIASGALKDNGRATLVGSRTFGKGLVQGIQRLQDGSGVNYTIAKYLTPSDTDIHNKGITPDLKVDLKEQDYKDGRGPWWIDPDGPSGALRKPDDMKDVQLAKAVEEVRRQIKDKVAVSRAMPSAVSTFAGQ